jgi:hypothetical protein
MSFKQSPPSTSICVLFDIKPAPVVNFKIQVPDFEKVVSGPVGCAPDIPVTTMAISFVLKLAVPVPLPMPLAVNTAPTELAEAPISV